MDLTGPASEVEALPEVIESVTTPRLFAPSRFALLMRCPLKEIHGLPEEEMLPPSPLAILGDVIHEVMSEARGGRPLHGRSMMDYVDELFDRKIRSEEERLSENPRTKRRVPLRRAVGKSEYRKRKARLHSWAKVPNDSDRRLVSGMSSESPGTRSGQETEPVDTARIPLGAERTIRVSSLRLSGRPDLIERDEDGTYHVTDFKTGDIVDRADEPRADYALQLKLYALMLREIGENASLRLWLEGSERIEVEWDEDLAAETIEQLVSVTDRLPADQVLPATELAKAGPHCGSCRIRHRCARYRSVAPDWWIETSSKGRVAPFDIWGEVETLRAEEATAEVVLRDAAGRRTRVTGVRTEGVRPSDGLWYFDLQPTQRLPHHGLFIHPHNFHGHRPDRVWRDAVGYSEFIEPRTAE